MFNFNFKIDLMKISIENSQITFHLNKDTSLQVELFINKLGKSSENSKFGDALYNFHAFNNNVSYTISNDMFKIVQHLL